jgi:hypothetical protein
VNRRSTPVSDDFLHFADHFSRPEYVLAHFLRKDQGASQSFDQLLDAGCDRHTLSGLVIAAQAAPNRRAAVNPRQVRRLASQCGRLATLLEKFSLAVAKGFERFDPSSEIAALRQLDVRLRDSATIFDTRRLSRRQLLRMVLSDYVRRTTGSFHDRLVADVLTATSKRLVTDKELSVLRGRASAQVRQATRRGAAVVDRR